MRIPVGASLAEWGKDSLPCLLSFQGLHQCFHPISGCLTCLTFLIHFLDSNLEGVVPVFAPQLKSCKHRLFSLVISYKISIPTSKIFLHNYIKIYITMRRNYLTYIKCYILQFFGIHKMFCKFAEKKCIIPDLYVMTWRDKTMLTLVLFLPYTNCFNLHNWDAQLYQFHSSE